MSLKDLFGNKSKKVLSSTSLAGITDVESPGYVVAEQISEKRYVPSVDFATASNFAVYGSAKAYYQNAIAHIYQTYPYDGSHKEKTQWHNTASNLDNYFFEKEYPRTTGYLNLNSVVTDISDYTTIVGDATSGFIGTVASPQYIYVKGGPNKDPNNTEIAKIFPSEGGIANIYDQATYRVSNLALGGARGNTVEFWDSGSLYLGTSSYCIFDLWSQGEGFDSASYGRFMLERSGSGTDNYFMVSYASGSDGIEREQILIPSAISSSTSWNHFAISLENTGSDLGLKLYQDGALLTQSVYAGAAIGNVSGALNMNIGSYLFAPTASLTASGPSDWAGYGVYNNSIDEFRFWKEKRTSQDIGRNWFTQVFGGTNTDDANTTLGVYFKFNEGILDTLSVNSRDAVTLDYSGRISNGLIRNYDLTVRSLGSCFDEYGQFDWLEFKDPIIYSNHPDVVSLRESKEDEGLSYDLNNNAAIWNTIPDWIVDEDVQNNEILYNLVQIMSSYFDELQLFIKELPKIKQNKYYNTGDKPLPFADKLLTSMGLNAPSLFSEADFLEALVARSDSMMYEDSLSNLKNIIYQNIYNNLSYIYKAKGTEKAFRNLIRCFGIDRELLKINLYVDGPDYELTDKWISVAEYKKYLDLNDPDRFVGSCYQNSGSVPSAQSYFNLSALTSGSRSYIPLTFETSVIFPKKFDQSSPLYFETPFITASIMGQHSVAGTADPDTWLTPDNADLQVYAIKPDKNSKQAKFLLTSSNGGPLGVNLETSFYEDVYDNSRWQFAVRLAPARYDLANRMSGSFDTEEFLVEFYGVRMNLDIIEEEFHLTQSVIGLPALYDDAYRFYVGSEHTNFTGSTAVQRSDAKISNAMYWFNYISNDEVKAHARDIDNFGSSHPYRSAYFGPLIFDGNRIPNEETLALYWDFSNVTSSGEASVPAASDATFYVADLTSGSLDKIDRYGTISDTLGRKYPGQGDFFLQNDTNVVDLRFEPSAKQQLPEVMTSDDMVQIINTVDDLEFTRESRPINYFYAVEKSMYQNISEEMLNMFATILDFNNLIGEPVNRYRQEYKDMQKLRGLFYENVENTPSFEKYVGFYKWIDSAINDIIQQLIPASANFADDIRTMVESHILERNKYWTKFPTLEFKGTPPEGTLRGINELQYSWNSGHKTPNSSDQADGCLWWKDRAESSAAPSGDAQVDADRDKIRTVITTQVSGSTYATRRLSRPYKLKTEPQKVVRSGINYSHNQKPDWWKGDRTWKAGTVGSTTDLPYLQTNTYESWLANGYTDVVLTTSCNDIDISYKEKRYVNWGPYSKLSPTVNAERGNLVGPFNFYVQDGLPTSSQNIITNLHNDTYGPDYEVPMQSPFTEHWVGGSKYRHQEINQGEDTTATRPEGFIIGATNDEGVEFLSPYIWAAIPSFPNYPYDLWTRDELAKRPVNIENIKSSTGSLVLGNYDKDYEIVQTMGRSINNVYFVRNEGITGSVEVSTVITGVVDFTLPDRGRHEWVFVNRFSAPGGPEIQSRGFLDIDAEEYSIYNQMNWRNSTVRDPLNSWYTSHCGPFGFDSVNTGSWYTPAVTASFHKVNRNAAHRIDPENTSSCIAVYDNQWVQHQIPQSAWQYAWITASAASSSCHLAGFFNHYPNISASIDFVSGGTWSEFDLPTDAVPIPADFVGLSKDWTDAPSARFRYRIDNADLCDNTLTLSRFPGPDGVWNVFQDRAYLISLGKVYGYPSWKQVRAGENAVTRNQRKQSILTLMDPTDVRTVVTNEGQTIIYKDERADTFTCYTEPNVGFNSPSSLKLDVVGSNFDLNLMFPYENELEYFGNPDVNVRLGTGKCKSNAYENVTRPYLGTPEFDQKTVNGFKKLIYRQKVYPRSQNTGLTVVRLRTLYDEIAGTGSYGYDRGINERNKIWDTTKDTRGRSYPEGRSALGFVDSRNSVWCLDETKVSSSLYLTGTMSGLSPAASTHVYTASLFGYDHQRGSGGDLGIAKWNNGAHFRALTTTYNYGFARLFENNIAPFFPQLEGFGGTPPNGINGINILPNWTPFTASALYFHYPFISGAAEYYTGSTDNESGPHHYWTIQDETGLAPWYDNYDAYVEDIKPHSQGLNLIPEFSVSRLMPEYVLEDGGNFRARAENKFNLKGAEVSSSGVGNTQVPSNDFYKYYAHTDNVKNFDKIMDDHSQIGENTHLTLRCKGIKKLLPYNGFYPTQRSEQIVNLFSQSFDGSLVGDLFVNSGINGDMGSAPTPITESQATNYFFNEQQNSASTLQTALQPWFAPGILYNTVKSGLAVDWAAYKVEPFSQQITEIDATSIFRAPIATWVDPFKTPTLSENGLLTASFSGSQFGGGVLTSSANYRLPFESLLNPEDYLIRNTTKDGNTTLRVVSNSSGVSVQSFPYPDQVMPVLAPSHYPGLADTALDYFAKVNNGQIDSTRYPFVTWNGKIRNNLYHLAINNFLGEIPKFFLKERNLGNHLNTFVSAKQSQFLPLTADKSYYMDVVIDKSDNFAMFKSPNDGTQTPTYYSSSIGEEVYITGSYGGRYFGPPVLLTDPAAPPDVFNPPPWYEGLNSSYNQDLAPTQSSTHHMRDPSYAPYTPPYFYGKSSARLKFTPTDTRKYSLREIQAGLEYEEIKDELAELIFSLSSSEFGTQDPRNATNPCPAYESAMPVSASVNLLGAARLQEITSNENGFVLEVREQQNADNDVWVISTRMETPTLNYNHIDKTYADANFSSSQRNYDYYSSPYGMWLNAGRQLGANEGVYMSIAESFQGDFDRTATGSLLDICGFTPTSKRIGEIADQKEFTEAIVAIPFLDYPQIDPDVGATTVPVGNRHFFAIDKGEFGQQYVDIKGGKPAVSAGRLGAQQDIAETSISKMIVGMERYNIPPEFDFVTYFSDLFGNPNQNPFVMYIFEFGVTLDKEDLANVWQGVMPKIARIAEKDEISFSHPMNQFEFFGGKKLPPNIRWLTFKVKRKAEMSYFNTTADTSDDNRFKFTFDVGDKPPEYSYNWPYDYCSLVEYAGIEAELEIGPPRQRDDDGNIITGARTLQFADPNRGDFTEAEVQTPVQQAQAQGASSPVQQNRIEGPKTQLFNKPGDRKK